MKSQFGTSSWVALVLFYLILVLIVSVLDNFNGLLTVPYLAIQVVLLTVGVLIFMIVGYNIPNMTPIAGVLLAFTVGVLTIIPAILMGIGDIPGFWRQYFSIAGGMAAGSFLTFLFLGFSRKLSQPVPTEADNLDEQAKEEELVKSYLNH